jgi:hypothetical protein
MTVTLQSVDASLPATTLVDVVTTFTSVHDGTQKFCKHQDAFTVRLQD